MITPLWSTLTFGRLLLLYAPLMDLGKSNPISTLAIKRNARGAQLWLVLMIHRRSLTDASKSTQRWISQRQRTAVLNVS